MNNEWTDFWDYVVGPLVGATIIGLASTLWKRFGNVPLD